MVIDKLLIKRGENSNLPTLDISELGFTTDDKELYIGSSTGNINIAKKNNIVQLNSFQNLNLSVNTMYDVISSSIKNSTLTLPNGTKTGQTIEIITSCSGISSDNNFIITGNINGVTSNTVTILASYVKYTFIWSNTSQTWVLPRNVII